MKYFKLLGIDKKPISWYKVGKNTVIVADCGITIYPAIWDMSTEPDIVPATKEEFKSAAKKQLDKILKSLEL